MQIRKQKSGGLQSSLFKNTKVALLLLLRDIDCIRCVKVSVASTAAQAGNFGDAIKYADVIGGPLGL